MTTNIPTEYDPNAFAAFAQKHLVGKDIASVEVIEGEDHTIDEDTRWTVITTTDGVTYEVRQPHPYEAGIMFTIVNGDQTAAEGDRVLRG